MKANPSKPYAGNPYDLATYYRLTPETWDAKQCARMAQCTPTDGLGTPYPFAGICPYRKAGPERFNGGCLVRDGRQVYDCKDGDKTQWVPGVIHTLPRLARGFKWVSVLSWGWRIVGPNSKPYGTETVGETP